MAVRPSIIRMLKTFEPVTFPNETAEFPSMAPVTLTTSSGQEVPKPTMIMPITNSLMPIFRATLEAPSTKMSEP